MQKNIELNPADAKSYHEMGLVHLNNCDYKKAREAFLKAIELNPENAMSHHELGTVNLRRGEFANALKAYEKAIELNPENTISWQELGMVYFKNGEITNALKACQKAIELDPDYVWTYSKLGEIYFSTSNFTEAIKAYKKAITLKPDHVWFYFDLGRVHSAAGNLEEAAEAFEKATELNPEHAWTYYKLGEALFAVDKFAESVKPFEKAIELDLDFRGAYNYLGDALSKIGYLEKAKDCYRMAVKKELARDVTHLWDSGEQPKPNFLIIGYSMCGTTSLYEYLIQHPQILPAAKKEIKFFSEYYDYGIDWYISQLPPILKRQKYITGEATPHYINCPQALERIYYHYPDVKLIVLLRDPIERTYSEYQNLRQAGKEYRSFENSIASEMDSLKRETHISFADKVVNSYWSYFSSSLYFYSLKRWMTLFPRKQFLVLQTKDLYSNPNKVLGKIFHFLGVDDYKIESYPKPNVESCEPMNDDIRNRLKEYFQPHNQLLEEFLGMKFKWHDRGLKAMVNRLKIGHNRPKSETDHFQQSWVAFEPNLIPPSYLMRQEKIEVLEEWFRWAEEWSMILKVYGKITRNSNVLEIGCGLGRIAFPLRYVLLNGSYEGFEICHQKVDFLQKNFHSAYPNFNFTWANVKNTHYNPAGMIEATDYLFPYEDNLFDIVYAASVFTHMLPDNTAHYFKESARVLKPNGSCVFSFFILDYYRPGEPRPLGFSSSYYNFDYHLDNHDDDFAIADRDDPEKLTAYKLSFIERLAKLAGLELHGQPLPGLWSGSTEYWTGTQDLIILRKC